MKVYYKLVRKGADGRFMSALAMDEFSLVYKPGKVTKPHPLTDRLMVFETEQQARDFAYSQLSRGGYVLQIEGKEEDVKDIIPHNSCFASKEIRSFWFSKFIDRHDMWQSGWPNGTVFLSQAKVMRRKPIVII